MAVSILITATMGLQYVRRRKPYQLVWTVAFLCFATGTASEWVSHVWGWSPLSIRLFYLSGAILTTGYLALGLIWLQWPGKPAQAATWVVVILSLAAAVSLWRAPIDLAAIPEQGWEAMMRPPVARGIGLLFNIGGTLLLVGGTLASALRMRRNPLLRRRALGLLILTLGVAVVAAGGSMVGFLGLAEQDALAVTNALGAALMWAGILVTDRARGKGSGAPATTRARSA